MKFLALALVANSIMLASASDSDKIKNEVQDLFNEIKDEIEEKLPESNLFVIKVVEEVAENVNEAGLQKLENQIEKTLEEMGPVDSRIAEIDIKKYVSVEKTELRWGNPQEKKSLRREKEHEKKEKHEEKKDHKMDEKKHERKEEKKHQRADRRSRRQEKSEDIEKRKRKEEHRERKQREKEENHPLVGQQGQNPFAHEFRGPQPPILGEKDENPFAHEFRGPQPPILGEMDENPFAGQFQVPRPRGRKDENPREIDFINVGDEESQSSFPDESSQSESNEKDSQESSNSESSSN